MIKNVPKKKSENECSDVKFRIEKIKEKREN